MASGEVELDFQFLELVGGDVGGGLGHQVLAALGLGEGDDAVGGRAEPE